MAQVRMLANTVVGLGFSRRGFEAGLALEPDMIGCDAGSADGGPAYLGMGTVSKSRQATMRDLEIMMRGARDLSVPLVIGSCGGAGTDGQVDGYHEYVAEVAADLGWRPVVARIYAEQDKDSLVAALRAGRTAPLGHDRDLTEADIESSGRVVAMMGAGPIKRALEAGADIVLAGRCADPAIFAATGLAAGVNPAPVWHAAKSIDKGYLATERPERGSPVLATVTDDHFIIEPAKPDERCTVLSVGGMTMYENADPFEIIQPSGVIAVEHAAYEQLDDRRVKVTGSAWIPAEVPSVKLEGARQVGFRAVTIAGLRDDRLINRFDEFLDRFRSLLTASCRSMGIEDGQWSATFRAYGRNAVLGGLEPRINLPGHEIGLVIEVVADTQDLANAIAARSNPVGSRLNFTGETAGGGNFAFPFSPNVLRGGAAFDWSVWHTMTVADEVAPFRQVIGGI
jgi:hypothetical protein